MNPINYMSLTGEPVDPMQFLKAKQIGDAQRASEQANQDAQLKANMLAQQREVDIASATQPGADPRLLVQMALRYPELGEKVLDFSAKKLDDVNKKEMVDVLGKTMAYIDNGRPELAVTHLESVKRAYENGGRDVSGINDLIKQAKEDPSALYATSSMMMAQGAPEAYAKFTGLNTAREAERIKINADLAEIRRKQAMSDIDLAGLGIKREELEIERQKLLLQANEAAQKSAEPKALTPFFAKAQEDAISLAQEANGVASEASSISDMLKANPPTLIDRMKPDFWLNAFGGDYAEKVTRIRSALVKAVKGNIPGTANISNADIAFAQKPVPPASADNDTLISYFNRVAKIQNKIAVGAEAKAAWLEQNGNLDKLKSDLILSNGMNIPAGVSIVEAGKLISEALDKQLAVPAPSTEANVQSPDDIFGLYGGGS